MHKYKKALVLGAGRSGRAAEALLRSEGTQVVTVCEETTPDYDFKNSQFEPEVAVMSPGFSLDHPWVQDLSSRGIPLLSEIELGWSRRHCPVIAVTGSNGKSTVVKWIVETLAAAGQRAIPCGNYGFPVSGAAMMHDLPDWLVIEVSSFQLETIREFRPEIGVLLNVLPNHLDRHGSMDVYRRIKLRLFENMIDSDTAIVPAELFPMIGKKSSHVTHLREQVAGNVWKTFGTEDGADFCYRNGFIGGINLTGTRFANEILGPAAAAVAAVCDACGVPASALEQSARAFEPLPHRMQTVAEINGVRFINDSKATNLAATCAALRMCPAGTHLIAGGRSKENDLSFAKDLLAQRVSRLYLIGEASSAMQTAWEGTVECCPCGTLDRAVSAAWEKAKPGDTVLLSPACTSFDQFCSFNERGDCFTAAVRKLSGKDAKS